MTTRESRDTQTPPALRFLYDESEAAYLLSVSPRTLFNLRAEGRIVAGKIGSRVVYNRDELKRFARTVAGVSTEVVPNGVDRN
jgi:hypothetical protein